MLPRKQDSAAPLQLPGKGGHVPAADAVADAMIGRALLRSGSLEDPGEAAAAGAVDAAMRCEAKADAIGNADGASRLRRVRSHPLLPHHPPLLRRTGVDLVGETVAPMAISVDGLNPEQHPSAFAMRTALDRARIILRDGRRCGHDE